VLVGAAGLVLVAIAFGFAYGSSSRIAAGVTVDGIDVGGLKPDAAVSLLRERTAKLLKTPLVVHVSGRRFTTTAAELGVLPEWAKAVDAAQARGDGFAFVRGYRRLYVRFFGATVTPHVDYSQSALNALLDRIERTVDVQSREAALVRHGLRIEVVPGREGRKLDRARAAATIVAALSGFTRDPVWLPTMPDRPRVTAKMLQPLALQAKTALSEPVRLVIGPTYYRLPRWRLAEMLSLPRNGGSAIRIAGPAADAFFARLEKVVNSKPQDARFAVDGPKVTILPDQPGRALDVPATAKNVLSAALSPTDRIAKIVVGTKPAKLTARAAAAMGITGLVSSYTTEYGGVPNRIHNVQLVAQLIDNHLIPPGHEFSFNATTGARTPEKGFLTAPVIINGELQNALGGGVCQVSTTVFNAAYEAGLNITARTNHALYISHYPQGRDATVNYPDTDLKFVNDTGHWLLLRTFVGSYSLTVSLYGTPQHRRVVSETAPLVETGPPPVKHVKDPNLFKGQQVVRDPGSPSLSTSVHRKVYSADGKLLYDNVWYSSYRGNYKIVAVGTKPKPKPKPVQQQPQSTTPIVIPPSPATVPPATLH
jgi:vancomycin resistance protein YoaR